MLCTNICNFESFIHRLAHAIIYNAPTIFWGLWQAAQPFVDPVTREKIIFIDDTTKETLSEYVSDTALPASLGGQAALVPIEQATAVFGKQ